jgi:predicted nucleotidyltransferase
MIPIEQYLDNLIKAMRTRFEDRLLYIGLQGSYLRGEATEDSDVDVMVVIDGLNVADLEAYRECIRSLEHADKSCGFICSKDDLAHWNPMELCHVLHTTKDCYGVLKDLLPPFTRQDIRNFVKMGLNNLYHEICHRYIHSEPEKNAARLAGSYKSVFFILQNLYYLRLGQFAETKAELLQLCAGQDRAVLQRSMDLNNGISHDFADSFALLFTWCQNTLHSL